MSLAVDDGDMDSSRPPDWLPPAHQTVYLGFHGFRPAREGEILSADAIRDGSSSGAIVSAETWTAHGNITQLVTTDSQVLPELEDLLQRVFVKRQELRKPEIGSSTFKFPSRLTLNEPRKIAWFEDLANPDTPLSKLKNVPHGFKGAELFDKLHEMQVPIDRAVYYVRVIGANETQGIRNKLNYHPNQHSVDWATSAINYLKRLLSEIVMPNTTLRATSNIKQTFKKGIFSETDTRERWVSRFSYILSLLQSLYFERLVDHCTFLNWLSQQLIASNIAQAPFVARLTHYYIEDIALNRAFTRPVLDGCLNKIAEVRQGTAAEQIQFLQTACEEIIINLFCLSPDSFVSPRNWVKHENVLREIISAALDRARQGRANSEKESEYHTDLSAMNDAFADVKGRNEALLFRTLPAGEQPGLQLAVRDVQLLTSISRSTDWDDFTDRYFNGKASDPQEGSQEESEERFMSKLRTLITWAIASSQQGEHRPYATTTVLKRWRVKAGARAAVHGTSPPDDFLQAALFDWLDDIDPIAAKDMVIPVAQLYGELVHAHLFSYDGYLQRLLARGEEGMRSSDETHSKHHSFLRAIPLHDAPSALVVQRKVVLYGLRSRNTPEDETERRMRRELREVLPQIFSQDSNDFSATSDVINNALSTLLQASRFEQTRTVRYWLLPLLVSFIERSQASEGLPPLTSHTCGVIFQIMRCTKSFGSLLDFCLSVLRHSPSTETASHVCDILKTHSLLWSCYDGSSRITQALHALYLAQKTTASGRPGMLGEYVLYFDNAQWLDGKSRHQIALDLAQMSQRFTATNAESKMIPPRLAEILLLAQDPRLDAPQLLAANLWYTYRGSAGWAWVVWDNVFACLRQIPAMANDDVGQRRCALLYTEFLKQVDKHYPPGLNGEIASWLHTQAAQEYPHLPNVVWSALSLVFLHLVIGDVVKSVTILRAYFLPIWKTAVDAPNEIAGPLQPTLPATFSLAKQLFHNGEQQMLDNSQPLDLTSIQRLEARTNALFTSETLPQVLDALTCLGFIQESTTFHDSIRSDATKLRDLITSAPEFRLSAAQQLHCVRKTFENLLEEYPARGQRKIVYRTISHVLRCIGKDSIPNEDDRPLDFLNPWTTCQTSAKLHFSFKQLNEDLNSAESSLEAESNVQHFTSVLFDGNVRDEQIFLAADILPHVEGPIASKFLSAFFSHVIDDLSSINVVDESGRTAGSVTMDGIGNRLRLLVHLIGPLHELDSTVQLSLETQIRFTSTVSEKLRDALQSSSQTDQADALHMLPLTLLLVRILNFFLALRQPWFQALINSAGDLTSSLLQCALLFTNTRYASPAAFYMVFDILCFLLDEMAQEQMGSESDPFKYSPHLPSGLSGTPSQYHNLIRSILPVQGLGHTVEGLFYADKSDPLEPSLSVQYRPWEWIENTETREPLGFKGDAKTFNTSTSLPMKWFRTTVTSDRILPASSESNADVIRDLRSLEDRRLADSVFVRDWQQMNLLSGNQPESKDGGINQPKLITPTSPFHPTSPVPLSAVTRSSAHREFLYSPGQSSKSSVKSDGNEPDAVGGAVVLKGLGTRTSKRKASSSLDDHDSSETPSSTQMTPVQAQAKNSRTTRSRAGSSSTRGRR